MTARPTIRIFLSSPGDVNAERLQIRRIIEGLQHDPLYKAQMQIEIVAWDDPHSDVLMPVTLTPQQAIDLGLPKPSECDIVITLFWGRMGTPLDEAVHGKKADGKPYWSGTEWEYLDGVRGSSSHPQKLPVVYLYRRTDPPPPVKILPGQDPLDAEEEHVNQRKRVRNFFAQFRDAKTGAYKAYYHEYDSLDAFKDLLEKHIRTLLNHAYKVRTEVSVAPSAAKPNEPVPPSWDIATQGSPFPGLKAFDEAHEAVYFGRAREVAALVRRLSGQRLQVIVGASGSGKSSLVRAGLLPKLRDNAIPGSAGWSRVTLKPGKTPFVNLADALISQTPELGGDPVEHVSRCEKLAEILAAAPDNLHRTLASALYTHPHAQMVLFIDQFEEVFTLPGDEADTAQRFIEILKAPSDLLRIVVTIRSDFYDQLLPHFEEELREANYTLAAPNPVALHEMITRPAERAGLVWDDGLPERIQADTGNDAGALALLAYALDELYRSSHADNRLTTAAYEAIGGVEGAIGRRAEQTFAALALDDKEQVLQRVFRELVTVDERGTATRQRAGQGSLDEAGRAFVQAFVEARLLVVDGGTVEVAHEALFRRWERLAEWIAEAQEDLILLRQLRSAAVLWASNQRSRDFLWLGDRGRDAQAMIVRLRPDLNEIEQAFARPEAEHLLDELADTHTVHPRRSEISTRLHQLEYRLRGAGVGEDGVPEMVWLPVEVSSEPVTIKTDEIEIGPKVIKPFCIAQYLVTYEQYQAFVDHPQGFAHSDWWDKMPEEYQKQELEKQLQPYINYPRDNVSWYQSVAFARWMNHCLRGLELAYQNGILRVGENAEIRLPTEWEWQWAAQGGEGKRAYPWDKWQDGYANTSEAGLNRTTAAGMYPQGAAVCGALDMAGNLFEWCQNDREKPEIVDGYGNGERKVLRGGSFDNNQDVAAAAYRHYFNPNYRNSLYGLRLVLGRPL